MIKKNKSLSARVETLAKNYVKTNTFPSIEWLIHKSGHILSEGFIKSPRLTSKIQLEHVPIYRIYSMTKPIIAFAGLIALEQQKIKLSDPVAKYIESFHNIKVLSKSNSLKTPDRAIILDDLFTHRSGLSYGFNRFCPVGKKYYISGLINNSQLSLKAFVKKISEFPIAFEPGTAWRYSLSTDVLARVLEVVFGTSIENILFKFIFKPVGMIDTRYYVSDNHISRVMPVYGEENLDKTTDIQFKISDMPLANVESFYPSERLKVKPRGGHGLFSTAADYARFANMLLTGKTQSGERLISHKMLKFSLKNRLYKKQRPLFIDTNEQYGYGWNLLGRVMKDTARSLSLSNKGEYGWAGAASTYFWIDPEYEITGIVMSQFLGSEISLGEEIKSITYTTI